jgi:AcrR family transcriptional regulator
MNHHPAGGEHGKRQTLQRLLAAARREFAEKGRDGARIDEIAERAGVTKQLVYHYYHSKDALFCAVLDQASEEVVTTLAAFDAERLPPAEALRALVAVMFDQYRDDRALGALAQEGIRYHEDHETPHNRFPDLAVALLGKLERIFERGIASGELKSGIDLRLFLATAALLTSGAFTNRYLLSVMAGFDTTSPDGAERWRNYVITFMLNSVTAC